MERVRGPWVMLWRSFALPPTPVNIRRVFFYDYDSGGSSPKCAHVKYGWNPVLANWCADGVIDPSSGKLLTDVAAAVAGAAR
jgi:hypothetical protein